MKSVIFSALSLALLSVGVGCATRAAAKELPEGFPESTAAPLKAQSQEASPPGLGAQSDSKSKSKKAGVYTCPMHPEVTAPAPGQCPICGMHLEKKK